MKTEGRADADPKPIRPSAGWALWLALAFMWIPGGWTPLRADTHNKVNVPTHHNDLARTGQNLNETVLTPDNVNASNFGLLFSYPLDGWVFCQPLYVEGVTIPGKGVHNVVYIATMHDSVYAFDADNNQGTNAQPLWKTNFLNAAAGISAVPISLFGYSNPPELGITGTPVIDLDSGTIYVVAKTRNTHVNPVYYAQTLYALDIATGAPKFGSPLVIAANYPGTGDGSTNGIITFNPYWEFQRCALALVNGIVYVSFASQGDQGPYHGWVLGYDAHTLQLTSVFVDSPNSNRGGVWMSGAAPAADNNGNLYLLTGNGGFDANLIGSTNVDYGDSFLKLTPGLGKLTVADYFTPYDQSYLSGIDGDFGSGGVLLLPDNVGGFAHRHLAFAGGKDGFMFLLDRDNLGQYNPVDNSQVVQSINLGYSMYGMPAYFNYSLYFSGVTDSLRAYSIHAGQISLDPWSQAPDIINFPGPTPSISANGTVNGIVWIAQEDQFNNSPSGIAILRAYDATDLSADLYTSQDAGTRDQLGEAQKFAVPTIANGKVYTATANALSIFGNLGAPIIAVDPQDQTVTPGANVSFYTAASGTQPLSYQWDYGSDPIPAATNSWLCLTGVQGTNSGAYSVVVSNSISTTASQAAQLQVLQPPTLTINPQLQITLQGQVGMTYALQYLPDLTYESEAWVTFSLITLTNSTQTITDPYGPGQDQRYYRAVVIPQ